ncbi:hypothetical protein DXM25_07610 [Agrobacterium rosae]|nr:hypothetical protein DXM25_07610 [Agrobacterium rosae]
MTTEQPSSIILSLPKERCPAGASKDGGCGRWSERGVNQRMLRGFALRSKHLSFDRLRMMHEDGVSGWSLT